VVKKRLTLLGATGSIGTSTLDVIREQSAQFEIILASAHRDYDKLIAISHEFAIPHLVLTGIDEPNRHLGKTPLRTAISDLAAPARVWFGEDELVGLLTDLDYDIALNAISGSAGLRSTMTVLQRGKCLALANKESLVMAGHLVKRIRQATGAQIIPVDSEHSALFQAIGNSPHSDIRTLHITASGGAFRDLPLDRFDSITPQQALQHPNWDMGAKVTLDSATMFNKALEVIEAHWLFDLPYNHIDALIHPQSVIHSLVEYVDGSILAQLSVPDMRLPILYALSHPQRFTSSLVDTNLLRLGTLTFLPIEPERYPLFYTGLEVARSGGIMPTVMNAANEAALALFIKGSIPFTAIHRLVATAIDAQTNIPDPDLETILAINRQTYSRIIADH